MNYKGSYLLAKIKILESADSFFNGKTKLLFFQTYWYDLLIFSLSKKQKKEKLNSLAKVF
jgi:hypothetical protein